MARAGALCLALCLAAVAPPAWAAESPNDVARFLAGLPVAEASPLAPLTKEAAWQQHARSLDTAWSRVEKERLSKIRDWSVANLTKPQQTVLYMFSGPDFLYVNAFFPNRTTYVMSGLEPIGQIPSIAPGLRKHYGAALAGLRGAVGTALNYSFFITRNMQRNLAQSSLRGVLPVLYLFLARAGKTITVVTLIAVDNEGKVVEAGTKDATQGVKITFTGQEGKVQTLYYFQTDLSNGGVARSGFLKFCEQLGVAEIFIKSASYLLHSGNFSAVRTFLLDRAATVVQDDSGIPMRFFSASGWKLQPFGRYVGPISIFAGRYQRGLSELFRKMNPPRLEFGMGYRWRPHESNVLLASRTPRDVASETPRPQ
ncbi:MAG: hypothetical protein WAN86_04650 [Hyphomicrobiaceae bacterium]